MNVSIYLSIYLSINMSHEMFDRATPIALPRFCNQQYLSQTC